jgi:hypothetical protein
MTKESKRPDVRSALEVLADLATIIAAVLTLLAWPCVESPPSVMDGKRPAPTATTALHPTQSHRVPPVGGLLEAEAASVLTENDFEVRVEYAPATDGASVGRVLGQAPGPGSPSSRGKLVTIVIGSTAGR